MEAPLDTLAQQLPMEMAFKRQEIINEINAARDMEQLRKLAIQAVDVNFATRLLLRQMNFGENL